MYEAFKGNKMFRKSVKSATHLADSRYLWYYTYILTSVQPFASVQFRLVLPSSQPRYITWAFDLLSHKDFTSFSIYREVLMVLCWKVYRWRSGHGVWNRQQNASLVWRHVAGHADFTWHYCFSEVVRILVLLWDSRGISGLIDWPLTAV